MRALTRLAALAIGAALVLPGAMVPAHAGAATGGATEPTQIMNNIQLVMSYVKQAKNVENTLKSASYLKQSLRQLDPRTLAQLTGQPLDQVRRLVQMDEQLRGIMQSGDATVDVLQRALKDSKHLGISPSQYMKLRTKLALIRGGAWKQAYDNDTQKLKDLKQRSEQLQATAASIPSVSSQVDGLQQLLAQGTQTQAQMMSLNQSITTMNAMVAKQHRIDRIDADRLSQQHNEDAERLDTIDVSLPDPLKMDMTKDSSHP